MEKLYMSFDELDQLLFKELKTDARQSVRALARKVGLKRSTVRYRLDRLISEGMLRILCTSDVTFLGYKYSIVFGVRTRADRTTAIADHLVSLRAVKHISLTTGRFNIMALAIYRDESDIAHFISKDLADISDISSIETMHIIQRFKDLFKNKELTPPDDRPFQISDLDLSVIRAIEKDPRQTITNLAQTVGCSQPVAKAKLNKLINDGVIMLRPIIDPNVFGSVNGAVILIKPELDKLNAVVDKLSSFETILDINLTTGQWQIIAAAYYQGGLNTYDPIPDELSSVPGIKEFEILPALKILKFTPTML